MKLLNYDSAIWKPVANSQENLHFNKYINKNNNFHYGVVQEKKKKIKIWIFMAIVLNHQKLIKTSETKGCYNYL